MAYPTTSAAFSGLSGSIGALRAGVLPDGHAGPSVYVAVVVDTAGDTVQAVDFGFLWLIAVFGGYTSDGLYLVRPINPTSAPGTAVRLQWIDAITGLEVAAGTDLSGSVVNLFGMGL